MKKILICGAGEVGSYAAELLAECGHKVTVIDANIEKLRKLEESIDISSICGSACLPRYLLAAGVDDCDLLIAATNLDEINLLTSSLGKHLGAQKVIARIHHKSYVDNHQLNFQDAFPIDHIICPEKLTSLRIAEKLENPGVGAVERFAGSRILMHTYSINPSSSLLGTRLEQLALPDSTRIAVVQRGGEFSQPTGQTVLLAGDQVVVIGLAERFVAVERLFNRSHSEKPSLAIMGSSLVVEWLITILRSRSISIRLFESNPERAAQLADEHRNVTVLQSDPTDPDEFATECLERCTAFIAATDRGEHNILAALQAKQLGSKMAMAILYEKTYLNLVRELGIDFPFSPRSVATSEILRLIDDRPVRKLASLAEDVADVYAVGPATGGKFINIPLKNIQLPKGSLIAARERNGTVMVPGAEDQIAIGDSFLVIGPHKLEKLLTKNFLSK